MNEQELLDYCKKHYLYIPESGEFWHRTSENRMKLIATRKGEDYMCIMIVDNGKKHKHYAHKLIWLMMTGHLPECQIDHINNIHDDNRYCNLREATHQQNIFNRGIFKNNTTGYKGVIAINNRFRATIGFNNKRIHLGYYDTLEEAAAAYEEKARELFGEYYREIVNTSQASSS